MPFHSTLTGDQIHTPIAFEYQDSTLREGDTSLAASDLYKFARQTDDNTLWMLTSTDPTWTQVGLGENEATDSIYSADGDLTGSRTVTGTAYTLTFIVQDVDTGYLDRSRLFMAEDSFYFGFDESTGSTQASISYDLSSPENGIVVTASAGTGGGMKYAADYSGDANFDDRTIVDKGYVDSEIAGAGDGNIYTLDGQIDGVARDAFAVNSGSWTFRAKDDATDDDLGNLATVYIGTDEISLQMQAADDSLNLFEMTNSGIIRITDDTNQRGMIYSADYSSQGSLLDRWIPDKAYVESYYTTIDSGTRTVTISNGAELDLRGYNLTPSTYTQQSAVTVSGSQVDIIHITGDGAGGESSRAEIAINSLAMTVLDSNNSIGLQYAGDYSTQGAVVGDRWIPDKGYVDSVAGSNADTIYTADGTLSDARTVTGFSGDDLIFDHYNTATDSNWTLRGQMILADTGHTMFIYEGDGTGSSNGNNRGLTFNSTQIVFTDTWGQRGVEYAADYRDNYTDRSLVDRDFVLNHVGGRDYVALSTSNALADAAFEWTAYSRTSADTAFDYTRFRLLDDFIELAYYDETEDGTVSLVINTAGQATFTDGVNDVGLQYAGDYSSANGSNDRWIPDKAYVDSVVGGDSIYDGNGTISDAQRTVFIPDGNELVFRAIDSSTLGTANDEFELFFDADNGYFGYSERDGAGSVTGTISVEIDGSGIEITDSLDHGGLRYAANYASDAGFGNRSIPDKQYVDGAGIGYGNLTLASVGSRFVLGENGTDLNFGVYDTDAADYNDYVEIDIDGDLIALRHIEGDGAGGITSQRDFEVSQSGFVFSGGNVSAGSQRFEVDGGQFRLQAQTTTADHFQWEMSGDDLELAYRDDSAGQTNVLITIDSNGTATFANDIVLADGQFLDIGTNTTADDAWRLDGLGGSDAFRIRYVDADGTTDTRFQITPAGLLNYASDMSASYTNRTVVDKEYVDDNSGGGGSHDAFPFAVNRTGTGAAINGTSNVTLILDNEYLDDTTNYDLASNEVEFLFTGIFMCTLHLDFEQIDTSGDPRDVITVEALQNGSTVIEFGSWYIREDAIAGRQMTFFISITSANDTLGFRFRAATASPPNVRQARTMLTIIKVADI